VDLSSILAALVAGLFAGNLVSIGVVRWIATSAELLHSSPQGWRMAAAASLFNSGPWLVVVVSVFAYYVHSEAWAPWFFAGLGGALLLFGGIIVIFTVKHRHAEARRAKNAA
jgi:hypothetical protein